MKKIMVCCCSIFLWLLQACSDNGMGNASPDLAQATRVVKQMSSKRMIKRLGYYGVANKTPTGFVSYLFSDIGASEWPPSEEWVNPSEKQQMQAIGMELLPKGVRLFPRKVNRKAKRQIVISGDDKNWRIVVKGYDYPNRPPVFETSWPFPKFNKK